MDLTTLKIPTHIEVTAYPRRPGKAGAGDKTAKAIAKFVAEHEAKRKKAEQEKAKQKNK